MPEMAAASILQDIHCCVQAGQELTVDMNTQPNAEKKQYNSIISAAVSQNKLPKNHIFNYANEVYPSQHYPISPSPS